MRRWAPSVGVALACLAAASSAQASPSPPNSDLDDATAFSTQTYAVFGNIGGANEEFMENDHAGITDFQASLWWKWTAPSSQEVRIESCNLTQFDSVIAVYDDPAGADDDFPLGPELVSNDDGCADQSRVVFTPVAGEKYYITVTSKSPDAQNGPFTYEWQLKPTPANDDLAGATILAQTTSLSVSGDNTGATEEPDENDHEPPFPDASPLGGSSVWYSWTPLADADVTVDTCSSGSGTFPLPDSVIAVYEGDTSFPLTQLGADDNTCGLHALVRFDATGGETYLIAVDGGEEFPGEEAREGEFALDLDLRPPNDDFLNGTDITGALPLQNVPGTTAGASNEGVDEPAHAGAGAFSSVWYDWDPPADGAVTVDACDSAFEPRLGIYTGATLATLTDVDPDYSGCGGGNTSGRATFVADDALTYRIAVDVADITDGAVDLDIEEADLSDPAVTIDLAKIVKPRGKAKFTFSGTDNKTSPPNLDFTCRIDNKPEVSCTSPTKYKKLKKGQHTFRVFATDEAGNESPVVTEQFRSSRKP